MKAWKKKEVWEKGLTLKDFTLFPKKIRRVFWAKRIENMIQEIKFKIILCNLLILNKLLFELQDRTVYRKI